MFLNAEKHCKVHRKNIEKYWMLSLGMPYTTKVLPLAAKKYFPMTVFLSSSSNIDPLLILTGWFSIS
jgi:hypothetical protein